MAKQPQQHQDPDTTGHKWDGDLEEFNNPLPKWWVWIFYLTIIWGIWYTIAYPAWPGIKSATAGYLGFSTRAQVAEEIAEVETANAAITEKLASVELASISGDAELNSFALNAGEAVFNTWCVQCHGREGRGFVGYPTLSDDDWLWGGTMEDIHFTVTHGIRNEDDPEGEARYSEMPAFGVDELLEEEQVDQVVNFVMSLSGDAQDPAKVAAGAVVYEENCAACHMEDGSGDRAQGAPNLKDAIWLYGGDFASIKETVWNSRYGAMPNWNTRLSEAEIRAVATYVHQLGGGE
ncbi:cytochrome-c oxidase, cbb3-type subunit III [Marimonas arenosa]|uniref:Cbb3-type cytochrome c oxidase subunit n=1 Tax=Marimonas arenosa TaxID=1795305 RepID=A0AAE4B3V5_9RHOB|nr:cytochrome-c oxidase, cbb3-type subunit III [Marimonas arenosa]MDQ2089585.1 cytochrome-c oxidase, cbb3-type subunit III [Marimonas arenosa]